MNTHLTDSLHSHRIRVTLFTFTTQPPPLTPRSHAFLEKNIDISPCISFSLSRLHTQMALNELQPFPYHHSRYYRPGNAQRRRHEHTRGLDPSGPPSAAPLASPDTQLDLSPAGLQAWITCKDFRKDFAKLIAKGEGEIDPFTTA